MWLHIWGLLPVIKLLRNQWDQWKFQPLAAVLRKGQNCNQSLREKKEKQGSVCCSDPGLLHMKYMKELLFELLFCMVLWVSGKSATCVFRKVILLELLMWVQTVRYSKIVYPIYCMYLHTNPVWCCLDLEVVWSAVGSPEVENWITQHRPWVCGDLPAWLGVCDSLVHWTLPLHWVFISS